MKKALSPLQWQCVEESPPPMWVRFQVETFNKMPFGVVGGRRKHPNNSKHTEKRDTYTNLKKTLDPYYNCDTSKTTKWTQRAHRFHSSAVRGEKSASPWRRPGPQEDRRVCSHFLCVAAICKQFKPLLLQHFLQNDIMQAHFLNRV